MKQFFGAFFGSIIGIILATVIGIFITIFAVKATFDQDDNEEKEVVVKENSILKLVLQGPISDREASNPFANLNSGKMFEEPEDNGLGAMTRKIRSAADDDKIKGIYLNFKGLQAGFATIQELRLALADFKKKGKFIYAYGETFSEREYFLASVADKVFVNPQGGVEWKGLAMQLMFFKKTLEKLDVDVQVYRHGRFKSAIEPFLMEKMSAANRMQSEIYLNSIWGSMNDAVATSRKISVDELNAIANDLDAQFPEKMTGRLIDQLAYEDEVTAELKKKVGVKDTAKYKFVDFDSYKAKKTKDATDKIAVIYASGAIASGEGSDDEIGSDALARTIRNARLNKKIKAIVLRVNSPGGSALASEVIWREVVLAKKSKPVIVSMGDVAASGGYYISCGADKIFAEPNTITGSIGVFGLIPNLGRMMENKFGITVDTVNTNKYSDVGNSMRLATPTESAYIQKSVEQVYATFMSRVAEGRKMDIATVDSIGQGRIWTGTDAKNIGLVDELGGLNEAITFAAKKAGLKDYSISELPKIKNPFEIFLGKQQKDVEEQVMKQSLGETYVWFKQARQIMQLKGVQARLPFEIIMQ